MVGTFQSTTHVVLQPTTPLATTLPHPKSTLLK